MEMMKGWKHSDSSSSDDNDDERKDDHKLVNVFKHSVCEVLAISLLKKKYQSSSESLSANGISIFLLFLQTDFIIWQIPKINKVTFICYAQIIKKPDAQNWYFNTTEGTWYLNCSAGPRS